MAGDCLGDHVSLEKVIISEPLVVKAGKIEIPKDILDEMRIRDGDRLVAMGDSKRREIVLYHISDTEAKFVEIRVTMKDVRGSIAKLTQVFADAEVNVETAVLPPAIENKSIFTAILNLSKLSIGLADLESMICALDFVIKVDIESH